MVVFVTVPSLMAVLWSVFSKVVPLSVVVTVVLPTVLVMDSLAVLVMF